MWDTDPMIPFPPVVEPDLPGAFITKHPRDEHKEDSLKIPFLTGLTFDEGVMKSARKLTPHKNHQSFSQFHFNI